MATKPYIIEKKIGEKTYKAQFMGVSVAMRALDEWRKENENISLVKMAEYVLEHVIVEPKGLTMDDFDCMDDLNEVVAFGREVFQGNFRKQADEGAAKAKG